MHQLLPCLEHVLVPSPRFLCPEIVGQRETFRRRPRDAARPRHLVHLVVSGTDETPPEDEASGWHTRAAEQ